MSYELAHVIVEAGRFKMCKVDQQGQLGVVVDVQRSSTVAFLLRKVSVALFRFSPDEMRLFCITEDGWLYSVSTNLATHSHK